MSPSPQNKLRKTLRTRRASVLAKTSIINKKKVPQKAALHRLIHDSGELIKKKTSMLDGPDNTPQFLQPKPVPTTENSVDCDYAPDELKPKTSSRTDESGVGDNVSDKLNPETMLPLKEDNRQKKSKIEKGKPTERKTKSVELSHYDSSESLDQYSESKNYDKNDGTDSHVEPILNQKDASDFDPESEDDQWEPENIHVNDTLEVFDNEDHSASDTDAETISGNCIDGMLKGFNKDIGALYNKTNSIEMEIKEIKRLLKSLSTQHCACRSLTSQFKQNSASSLLPKFPFLRKSEVRKMENNSGENEDYKLQMVNKLASYGGNTVQEIVINIFQKMFSSKLKTKYCWRGSSKGKGKVAFKKFVNIIDVIWSAVKVHVETCTEAMVKKQIKLRLNQAQKDYNREMEKQRNN